MMNKRIMQRAKWSKIIGFAVGLLVFMCLPLVWPDVSMYMRVGLLFWLTAIGGVVGVSGLFASFKPVCECKMSSIFRGAMLGGSFILMFVLVSYDILVDLIATATVFQGISPFWIIIDGIVLGAFLDFFATKKFGDGEKLLKSE